jgi:hypothetical protein
VVAALGLSSTACSGGQSATTSTTSTVRLDCAMVSAQRHKIIEAQSVMVDTDTTAPEQIADAARQIAAATAALGELSRPSLPVQTALWVSTTERYAAQIEASSANGTPVSQLLMDAHAFDSHAYQSAAQAVGVFFASACPS